MHQTTSAGAARAAAASGVVVPDAYVNRDAGVAAPIEVGGGSPMIYGFVTNARGAARVVVLTQEAMAVDHVIAKPGIAGIQDLKGKRLGFSGVGTVTHFSALSLARQLGWSPDRDITLVGGSATLDALKQDKVDAILSSAMVIALAPQAGTGCRRSDVMRIDAPASWWTRPIWPRMRHRAALSEADLRSDRADATGPQGIQRGAGQVVQHPPTQDGMFAHTKFEKRIRPSRHQAVFVIYDSPKMRTQARILTRASWRAGQSGFLTTRSSVDRAEGQPARAGI